MKTVSKKKRKQLEQGSEKASTSTAPVKTNEAVHAPFGVLHASKSDPSPLGREEMEQKYRSCETEQHCVDTGQHILHNPDFWKNFYVRQNPGLKRAMRALVQVQTIQALLRGKYHLPISTDTPEEAQKGPTSVFLDKKRLIAPALHSIKYESDHVYKKLELPFTPLQTVLQVISGDCLEVALRPPFEVAKEPLVLDMASMSLPGGGWRKASAAQEENLHRRTNLMHCLEDPYHVNPARSWSFPIPQFGGLYIPGVTVFRGSEPNGYPFLPKPALVSIVAAAALKLPPTEIDPATGEEILDKKLAKDTLRKIEAILSIAVEHGHEFLVLSAFGCGAYANPPGHVAKLFRQALLSPRFAGRFSHVVFAILDSELGTDQEASSSQSTPSQTESIKKSKAFIFAKAFDVDLLNQDGSVLLDKGS